MGEIDCLMLFLQSKEALADQVFPIPSTVYKATQNEPGCLTLYVTSID